MIFQHMVCSDSMDTATTGERPDVLNTVQTPADLRAELGKHDLGRHLALFYRSKAVQSESVAVYLSHGLRNGYRCLYLTDVNTSRQIKDALRAVGTDVEDHLDAGDLVIRDASNVYLDAGFDPERMIATLEEECQDSVSGGYEGLWMAGENSWCFHTEMSFGPILDFEVGFDAACPDLPVTALCQYDLSMFGEESAAKALWTHDQIIYRNAVCKNPFYIPPEEYRTAPDPQLNAQLMLEQAYSLTQSRRQVERREQRLSVLTRVLRHNLRNDLNFVEGALRDIGNDGSLIDRNRDRIDAAIRKIEEILAMADKARHVQRTLTDPTVERVSLASVLERAVDEIEATFPEAEVRISGERDISVLADTNLDTAVAEALRNGIVHQEGDTATVSLAVSIPAPETARIDISNPGSIPDRELRAVQQERETQLEHASGLGLWLITWIVENGKGTVQFPESGDDVALIRIELYRMMD